MWLMYQKIRKIKEINNIICDYTIGNKKYWKTKFNESLNLINIFNSNYIVYGRKYKEYNVNHINNIKNNIIFIVGPKIKFNYAIRTIRLEKNNQIRYYVYIIHILILDVNIRNRQLKLIIKKFLTKYNNIKNTYDIRKILKYNNHKTYKDLYFNIYLRL